MLGPALLNAAMDRRRVRGDDVRLLVILTLHPDAAVRLDPVTPKPLKHNLIAHAVLCLSGSRFHRRAIGRSLARLAGAGYLERTDGRLYRLCWGVCAAFVPPHKTPAHGEV